MRTGRLGILLLLGCCLTSGVLASGEPLTPSLLVNRAYNQVCVREMGRVTLDFDVRSVGGAGLKLYLYDARKPPEKPTREWSFNQAAGSVPLDFTDLPLSVYFLVGVAVDAQGSAVARPAPSVMIEYGGWKAWRGIGPDPGKDPPVFAEAGRPVPEGADTPQLFVLPAAVLCGFGKSVVLTAAVGNLPADEVVLWELEGEGELKVLNARQAMYTAPRGDFSKMVMVKARSQRFPEVAGAANVLVSDQSDESQR